MSWRHKESDEPYVSYAVDNDYSSKIAVFEILYLLYHCSPVTGYFAMFTDEETYSLIVSFHKPSM